MTERYNDEIRLRILSVLQRETVVTIKETAEKAKTMRIIARKHLERLVRECKAIELKKGPARLFMLKDGKKGDGGYA